MPRSSPRPVAHTGFTLMELLVVITIIAVLAALLLPAIKMVRGSAETTRCRSNMGQIGLAMLAYVNDNDGWVPPNSVYGNMGNSAVHYYWGTAFDYYSTYMADSYRMMKGIACPTHMARLRGSGIASDQWPARSYAANYSKFHWNAQPVAPIPRPMQTIYLAEKNGDLTGGHESVVALYSAAPIDQDTGANLIMNGITPGAAFNPGDTVRTSHRQRFNVLCLDGHAELVKPEDTVGTPCTSSGNVKPNRWTASY